MLFFPHLTQSTRRKSTPAHSADAGSKLSVASIIAQTSWRRVTSAISDIVTLARPDDPCPTISVKAPRGTPPVNASSDAIPNGTMSGAGRTSNADAGLTADATASALIARARFFSGVSVISGDSSTSGNTATEDMETSEEGDCAFGIPVLQDRKECFRLSLFIRL
jgi:hypothetical protein